MSYRPSRILTPVESRKRKERGEFLYNYTGAAGTTKPKPSSAPVAKLNGAEPAVDNRLLAGYMAYEFLANGTLFGQQFNVNRAAVEPKRGTEPIGMKEHERYSELATILKTEGTHIPGIVNPTQLARWIQM